MKDRLLLVATMLFFTLPVSFSSREVQAEEQVSKATSVEQQIEKEAQDQAGEPVKGVLTFKGLKDYVSLEQGATFDPKDGVTAVDSIDGDVTENIQISGKVDTSKVGMYPLTYVIKNSTGQKLEKRIQVSVIGPGSPDVDYHTIEIPSLTLPKYANFKQAIKDKMIIRNSKGEVVPTDEVKYTISSEGSTDQIGKMYAVVSIPYPNGVSMNASVRITVISGIEINEPDIDRLFTVGSKPDSFDPYTVFQAYEVGLDGSRTELRPYDAEKKVGVEVIENPVDFSKAGNYTVRYRITNSLGEVMEHTYAVKVQPLNELKITATDKVLHVGDQLTEEIILSWAKAENASRIHVEMVGKAIPINQTTNTLTTAGDYFIRYIAYQDSGKTAETTIKLTVTERPSSDKPVITSNQNKLPASTVNKKVASTSTPVSKATLPKTGSERRSELLPFVGIGLISFAGLFWKRKI